MPMNIKKSVKFSLFTLAAVVLLLLTAPLFFDVEDFKPAIIEQAEKMTGRSVEIGGISASLFPWVGIQLEDLRISNPEGFSNQAFFSVDSLDVEMALFPLFNKQVEIRRFVMDTPRFLLERNAQGVGNWQQPVDAGDAGIGLPEEQAPSPTPPAVSEKKQENSLLAVFTAEAISVNHGEIAWRDAETGAHTKISNLQLEMESLRLDSPIPVRLSGEVEGSVFTLDGQFGPVSDLNSLDLAKLPVQMHLKTDRMAFKVLAKYVPALAEYGNLRLSTDAQFEQRPDGLRLSVGNAKLATTHDLAVSWKLEMSTAKEALLRSMILSVDGKDMAQVRGKVRGFDSGIKYEMRLSTPEISRQALSSWLPQVETIYAAHPAPWQRLKLGMNVSGNMDHIDVRDLQLLLDDELVQASGGILLGKRPDIKLRVAAGTLHASPWLPSFGQMSGAAPATQYGQAGVAEPPVLESQSGALIAPAPAQQGSVIAVQHADPVQGQEVSGQKASDIVSRELVQGDASGTPEPDLRFLAPWRVAVQIQVEQMFLHGLELKHVRASLSGKRGKFQLNPLTFELAGGQVREHATLNVARYPAHWTESSTVSGMHIQPVLAALTGKDMLSGAAEMTLKLAGRGLLPGSAISTLSGNGNVLVRDGRIKGFDIPGMLQRLRMLGRETGSKSTDFTQLAGSFVINSGVVNNEDLFMASPLFRLTGNGRIDLTRQSMDYHIKPRLVGTLTGQGDTAGIRKGMTVPIHLVGPISSPMAKLEMNIQDLMGSLQGVIKEIKKGGKTDGVKRVLEELFPKR